MRETYNSGVEGLKELASLLERKASSDLNHINATISSRATFVENVRLARRHSYFCICVFHNQFFVLRLQFLSSVVADANEVICDIQNSVNEQRQILDFYTNQQEEVYMIHCVSKV